MPELPEVETIRRGIAPWVTGRTIVRVLLRVPSLRWPIPRQLTETLPGQSILGVERRAKYLLLRCTDGWALLHFGMSGHLGLVPSGTPAGRHDHIDIEFSDGNCLRFTDSRRFGTLLWTDVDPFLHPLLADLGPEPFAKEVCGTYLYRLSRRRRGAVKPFIMDQRTMAGVGNIYASEALFRAGIHPARAAGNISLKRYEVLVREVRQVLDEAIEAGGTSLRDFLDSEGKPGYFRLRLLVYGRQGEPCSGCGRPISQVRLGGRTTNFCRCCQR